MTNFLSKCNTYIHTGNKSELTSSTSKSRNVTLDIAKGLGIILVVLGHSRFPFNNFICLFHMALFFIISGYFFKQYYYKDVENIKIFIKKRIKSLYLPFIICNISFLFLHNFFLDINLSTNNLLFYKQNDFVFTNYNTINISGKKLLYILILNHWEAFGIATWFLKVLFILSISFCIGSYIIDKITKKYFELTRGCICFLCLLFGYYLYIQNFNFYQIGTIFSTTILFYLGILYKNFQNKINLNFITFLMSIIILLLCYSNNQSKFIIANNYYNNPIWLILASISGFFFILYISKVLSNNLFCSNLLSYIGQHTVIILCMHILFFKVITYLQVLIYNQPDYMLAALFPTLLFNQNGWWIAYGIVGIAGPLITLEVYKKLKQNINNKLQSLFH